MIVATLFLSFLSEDAELTPVLRLGAGACAGIIAMSATYPMDLVRGRITVQVLCVILVLNEVATVCIYSGVGFSVIINSLIFAD